VSIPYRTTPEQVLKLARIVVEMQNAGLANEFIAGCHELARVDQGVFELMELWSEAGPGEERDDTEADLQDLIDEAEDLPARPQTKPYVKFGELDDVARQVMAHKQRLRDLIDRHGGVTAVARRIGMPQPSLSRLLNSASMPRRSTLFRIATGLDVPEAEIVGEWVQ